ncbi:hypothetical protein [Aeromicrobium sp. Leaf350]|uniref:hypothetical protein n=1 Tax=Aeromicrobium sp. Leaf350 TaxID=2876565 RepID=UPI001E2D7FE3|nr:hypothetical protein [Aeromicrobium sp. Leaf350]
MLSRLLDGAGHAETDAFETVDRCCSEARRDYLAACDAADRSRSLALEAFRLGDVETAVSFARSAGHADDARRVAWASYREACALLMALVEKTAARVAPGHDDLAAAG